MINQATQIREPTIALPPGAPLVRITAGAGTAGQKTWNIRRPVTLIGSRRPAHIVLHGKEISSAHCVIVNTGAEVLIKDLRTSGGTILNREPVDLALLSDGDLIVIGSVNIQIAIQMPENASDDSSCGLNFTDPTKMATPLDVRLLHTETHWSVEDAVALIGRHEKAAIRLDHEDVARRHALLFRFGRDPAVFDLGGKNGIYVNGQCCTITPLAHGDCVTVAPFGLVIGLPNEEDEFCSPATNGMSRLTSAFSPFLLKGHKRPEDEPGAADDATPGDDVQPAPTDDEPEVRQALEDDVRQALEDIDDNIADSWGRLNSWKSRLERDANALSKQESDLNAKAEELDAKDAALRGQLFDITQFNEELKLRERDLARQAAELQDRRDALGVRERGLEQNEAELGQRLAEVQRRESALTQRWSRLRAVKCTKCGTSINVGSLGNAAQF